MSTTRFVPPDTRRWPPHWPLPTANDLALLAAAYRRGILPPHAEILRQPMPPLPAGSPVTSGVVEVLHDAVRRQQEEGSYQTVGMAAPQVGLAAAAIIFDPRDDATDAAPAEKLRCVINPTVHLLGEPREREIEGCLSTGRVRGWVPRASQVRLTGHTPAGDPIDEEHRGRAARVLQHEADHLLGIRFPDRITDDADLLWVSAEQDEEFVTHLKATRAGQATSPWRPCAPRDQWNAVLEGIPVFGDLAHAADRPADPTPTVDLPR